jgi:GNAT superfamily N-acetyltransferase
MIREITSNHLEDIKPIFYRLREQISDIPDNFLDRISDSVSTGKSVLFAKYSESGSVIGIGLFGKVSNRISLVFADGNLELEKELANALFDRFSKECPYIVTGGPWLSKSLINHLLDLGFIKHERAYMTLARDSVKSLPEPELPEGMKFQMYTKEHRQGISSLIFTCNDGHIDQDVFPEFFATSENCYRLLENIESDRYGVYKEGQSWLLHVNESNIGACFMTIRNDDTGYIPDICIDPEYREKGLGKALLIHSMKKQIELEDSLTKVDLDVTLSNNARFLYKSLGFTTVQEYSMYTWKK